MGDDGKNIVKLNREKLDKSYLIPEEGHKDVAKKVFRILEAVLKDREESGRTKRWLRNYEMVKNRHWKREPVQKVPLATANFCFLHHQRTINTITDNNPTFDIAKLPDAPDDVQEKSLTLERATDHWWVEEEQQDEFATSVWNGETYGCAVEKVMFDIEAGDYGVGEVQTISIDPFQFGYFPTDLKDPKRLETRYAILYFYPISVTEARMRWPDKKIEADREIIAAIGDDRKQIAQQEPRGEGFMSRFGSKVVALINEVMTAEEDDEQVLIVEAWVKDGKEERVREEGEDGTITETSRPRYTGDIRYICCCNGDTVLEDRDNPNINPQIPVELSRNCYLFNRRPFTLINSVRDTSDALGYSDLEQIERLQMETDKAISQFILLKDRSSRRKIKNPRTSGVKNSEFTNTQGVINPSNANEAAAIDYMQEPQIPVDIMQAIDLFKNLMLSIAGTFDVDQAMAKGNNRLAYKAIQALLERAGTMQRGKIRNYSRLIRNRGRMYISLVQNFYTEERFISYVDDEGEKVAKAIRGVDLIIPTKLTVVDGSTMPVSRVQQREEAIALRQMGVYDDEAVLKAINSPERKALLQRKKEGMLQPIMKRLQQLGMPQGLIQYLGTIATLDDKKFQAAAQKGQIAPFPMVLKQLLMQMQGMEDPAQEMAAQKAQADIAKIIAEVGKLEADKMWSIERAASERAEQISKISGIKYDEELLKNQRMQIMAELHRIETDARTKIIDIHTRKAGEGRSPYGLKTDNEDQEA